MTRNRNYFHTLQYVFCFATKYKQDIWTNSQRVADLKKIVSLAVDGYDSTILGKEIIKSNNLILELEIKPTVAPATVAKYLKGIIARRWFKEYPEDKKNVEDGHLWSKEYLVKTTGEPDPREIALFVSRQYNHNVQAQLKNRTSKYPRGGVKPLAKPLISRLKRRLAETRQVKLIIKMQF